MAVDLYMKVDGIDGESTDAGHDKWIELESCSQGVAQSVSRGSGTGHQTGGRADFQDITVAKTVCSASPDLFLACCNGKSIPKVEVEFCLATEDKHTFLKYELEDVVISAVSTSGGAYDDKPMETVSFAFGKIKLEYTPVDNTGAAGAAVDRTWDVNANEQG